LSSSATNVGASNAFTIKGRVPTEIAKEMTIEDINVTIEDHVHAAKCGIEAGFDAVEIVLHSPFARRGAANERPYRQQATATSATNSSTPKSIFERTTMEAAKRTALASHLNYLMQSLQLLVPPRSH